MGGGGTFNLSYVVILKLENRGNLLRYYLIVKNIDQKINSK